VHDRRTVAVQLLQPIEVMVLSMSVRCGFSRGAAMPRRRDVGVALALGLAALMGSAACAQATQFTASTSTVSATSPRTVAIGDFNSDGIPDLALPGGTNSVALRINDGAGTFTNGPAVPTAGLSGPASIALGDLNADGSTDFVVTNSTVNTMRVFRRNAATFTATAFSGVAANPKGVAIGDLNGDGKLDMAEVSAGVGDGNGGSDVQGTVTLFIRTTPTGAGTTTTTADYAVTTIPVGFSTSPSAIAIGDLDGDGDADVAVPVGVANEVGVLSKTGTGTSAADYTLATVAAPALPQCPAAGCPGGELATPTGIAIGDVSGDGRPDIVTADNNQFSAGGTVTVYAKDATGSGFTALAPILVAAGDSQTLSIAIGDLDGDGRADLATANKNDAGGSVSVLLKDAVGSGYTLTSLPTGGGSSAVAIADLAGAGKLDIVSADNLASQATIFANTTPQGTSATLGAVPASPSTSGTVTFTATVAKVVSGLRGSVAPTGTVTYTVDGVAQTPVTLSGAGTADFSPATLGAGSHTIDAAYSGDSNYAASTKSTSYTVTAPSVPPVVVSGPASAITASGASLAGTVDRNGLATTFVFEYGTTLSFGSITPADDVSGGSGATAVSASVSGLSSNTTYYYRLVAASSAGTSLGVVRSFNTGGAPVAPVAVTQAVSATTNTSAGLTGQVNPNGLATAFTFEYGTSLSFGAISPVDVTDDAIGAEAVTASLTGLSPDTTYYYRLVASNGSGTSTGAVLSFNTGPGGAPIVTTGAASSITSSGALLAGTVNAHGLQTSYTFEYGPSNAFGSITAVANAGSTNGAQSVSLPVSGLAASTTYRYRIVATNSSGTIAGPVHSFTTTGAGA
jgi:hypothetical protein